MLIGYKETFAIECYHDPLPNESRRVFGRMCLWVEGNRLGDINEPACMLNVTELLLQGLLQRLDVLDDPDLRALGDREAFELLDRAIYLDDARSIKQVEEDFERFFKFDMLTAGGESFDGTKSFILGDADGMRVLFEESCWLPTTSTISSSQPAPDCSYRPSASSIPNLRSRSGTRMIVGGCRFR